MVRLSKKTRDRSVCPRRPRKPAKKTGPLKDALSAGFKAHSNALNGQEAANAFIPKLNS
jgi:hypothetical protein